MPSKSAWLWISRGVSVGAGISYWCRGVCKWQDLGDCEGGGHLGSAQGGKATIGHVVVRRGTGEIFRNCRVSGSERIERCPSASEPRTGCHKSAVTHDIEATMDYMENGGVFTTQYDKWFDTTANVLQDDGSRIVCRLKQTCTPTGAARKCLTTVTDVVILNYAVGLDVARDGTQCNTQGVWPCKLPIESLPLKILAMSPDLMEALNKQPRRILSWTDVARRPTTRRR